MTSRRLVAVVVAGLLVLLAACGSDTDDPVDEGVDSDATTPAQDDAAEPGGEAPVGEDSTTTSPPNGSTPGPTSTTPGPTSSTAPPSPAFPALDGNVPVGQFAPSILRPDRSERIVLEIQADAAPRSGTLDHLRSTLSEVSGKAVEVVQGAAPGGGDRQWSSADLRSTADRGAAVAQGDGVAVLRMLFVHGSFEGDESTLGVAVRGDVAAVFVDRVAEAAGIIGSPSAIERSVSTHEVGHLLGLVDLYLDTGRDDPEHPGHSTNRNSVMYWAVESDVIGQILGANPPDAFDDADRADLAAIRGGA